MDPIDYIYVALAVIFALVLTYMVVYNLKVKALQKTLQTGRRPPIGTQESIAIATAEKEASQEHTLN